MTGQTRLKRTLELGSSLAVGIISSIIGACCSASSQSERGSRVPASRFALSNTWPDHDQEFVRRSLRMNTSRLPSPSLSRTLLGFGSCMRHATALLDLDSGMSGETFLNCAPRTSCSPPKTARSSGRWSPNACITPGFFGCPSDGRSENSKQPCPYSSTAGPLAPGIGQTAPARDTQTLS